MNKSMSGMLAIFAMSFATLFATTPQDPQKIEKDGSRFMHQKLDSSRDIVGGLAMEDDQENAQKSDWLERLCYFARPNVRLSQTMTTFAAASA